MWTFSSTLGPCIADAGPPDLVVIGRRTPNAQASGRGKFNKLINLSVDTL